MAYAEALCLRSAELQRKVQEHRQAKERVQQEIVLAEQEVAKLREEALRSQLEANQQRQELRKRQKAGRGDATKALRQQVERKRLQAEILEEETAKNALETQKLVEFSLSEATQAASTRDLSAELEWRAQMEDETQCLRDVEAENRQLEKDLKALDEELQGFPARAALLQLFAVMDEMRRGKEVLARQEAFRRSKKALLETWSRRLEEREQRLELVASTMDEKKRSLLEEDAAAQAEAQDEEKELQQRLARNQRRLLRAERDLEKCREKVEATEVAEGTLPAVPKLLRSASGALLGALQALDQEVHDRFGLLR